MPTLFGQIIALHTSAQNPHTLDAIVVGSYAPYSCTSSLPVCHAEDIVSANLLNSAHLSCLSCQYVLSVNGAVAISAICPQT